MIKRPPTTCDPGFDNLHDKVCPQVLSCTACLARRDSRSGNVLLHVLVLVAASETQHTCVQNSSTQQHHNLVRRKNIVLCIPSDPTTALVQGSVNGGFQRVVPVGHSSPHFNLDLAPFDLKIHHCYLFVTSLLCQGSQFGIRSLQNHG